MFEGEYLNDKKWIGTAYDIKGKILYKLNNNINGKGKEYFDYNNHLLFEGEYLNGKRWDGKGYDSQNNLAYELNNGKGLIKEYNSSGNLIFEGEYLNGERNGKGKEYNDFGDIKFEGEYLYGERNGKGKEYNDFGDINFEGEYLNGKRNGKGFYQDNFLKFDGVYLYGFKLKGKLFIENKLEFEGEFLFDKKWNGKGYDEHGNIIYELINGNGKVKEYENYGKLYFEGEYLNGKRNGKGKEKYLSGYLKYEGEYLNNKRNGKGKAYLPPFFRKNNGNSGRALEFKGDFLNDKKWNGTGYDGEGNIIYKLNNGTGNVKEYNIVGCLIYEGGYLNGEKNGKGKNIIIFKKD